ncbi:hypothetical protein Fmac_018603 [Flemingia macrophylla]|uniref:SKP1-like protein n=1 Tax=Flemingia macrophylla TaxID=520843 RepID=A0ABD1M5U8_9FABA
MAGEEELKKEMVMTAKGKEVLIAEDVMLAKGEDLKMDTLKIVEREEIKKIRLKSSDEATYEVEPLIVKEMKRVQSFINIEGIDVSYAILLPNITSRNLSRIIDFCWEHHHNTENLEEFKGRFLKSLNNHELKELLLAANYLNVKILFDFLCNSVADLVQNESPQFIRDFFSILNDAHIPQGHSPASQGSIDDD